MNTEQSTPTPRVDLSAEDGFTIIEVIVTAVVVVTVMIATFGALESAGRAGSEQRHHAESYAVAQKDQARMRALQISQLNGLDQTTTVPSGGTDYTVHSTGVFVNDTTGTASCDEGTNTSDYLSITSTVTWPSIGSRPPTVIKSIVAPPNGSLSKDKGALSVVVRDAAGNGIAGIPVSGSGAGSFSGSTGPTGCVLFSNLPQGNYTLTPSTASGVVDPDGKAPAPIATSVVGQSTNTVVLRYDTPGSIKVTFETRINGTVQATTFDSVVVFNTGMSDAGTYGTIGSPVSTLTATPLFPFTSPDAVYAGNCTDNNPNPDGLPNPPAAPAIAAVNVISNQTANATIQLPALNLVVTSSGSPLAGASVRITDSNCTVNGNPVVRTYTTNSAGKLDAPGLPYGTYDVCVSGRIGSRDRYETFSGVDVQTTATDTSLPGRAEHQRSARDLLMAWRGTASEERGITLVETLVGMVIGIAVLGGIVTLVTTTAKSSGRISERVAVDQVARPMFQRLMNELHSTCVSPGVAPILAGSTDTAITFLQQTGSAVTVTPVKRVVTWDQSTGNLTDVAYAANGGAAPDWTFSSTPQSSYRLLTRVSRIGSTPIFSYYAYVNGQISATPLPVPLSAANAAKAVQVNVSMAVSPSKSATSSETGAPVELVDAAFMRFSPSNEDTSQAGLPCT